MDYDGYYSSIALPCSLYSLPLHLHLSNQSQLTFTLTFTSTLTLTFTLTHNLHLPNLIYLTLYLYQWIITVRKSDPCFSCPWCGCLGLLIESPHGCYRHGGRSSIRYTHMHTHTHTHTYIDTHTHIDTHTLTHTLLSTYKHYLTYHIHLHPYLHLLDYVHVLLRLSVHLHFPVLRHCSCHHPTPWLLHFLIFHFFTSTSSLITLLFLLSTM